MPSWPVDFLITLEGKSRRRAPLGGIRRMKSRDWKSGSSTTTFKAACCGIHAAALYEKKAPSDKKILQLSKREAVIVRR